MNKPVNREKNLTVDKNAHQQISYSAANWKKYLVAMLQVSKIIYIFSLSW